MIDYELLIVPTSERIAMAGNEERYKYWLSVLRGVDTQNQETEEFDNDIIAATDDARAKLNIEKNSLVQTPLPGITMGVSLLRVLGAQELENPPKSDVPLRMVSTMLVLIERSEELGIDEEKLKQMVRGQMSEYFMTNYLKAKRNNID